MIIGLEGQDICLQKSALAGDSGDGVTGVGGGWPHEYIITGLGAPAPHRYRYMPSASHPDHRNHHRLISNDN